MHHCPACNKEGVLMVELTPAGVLMACPHCSHQWQLVTLTEGHHRELLARSLELAAIKAGALR